MSRSPSGSIFSAASPSSWRAVPSPASANLRLGLYDQGPGGPMASPPRRQHPGRRRHRSRWPSAKTLRRQLRELPPRQRRRPARFLSAAGRFRMGPRLQGTARRHPSARLQGPLTVKGGSYRHGGHARLGHDQFHDEKIADLMTYIRASWGNTANAVQPAEVTAAAPSSPPRADAYSEGELLKIAPNGPEIRQEIVIARLRSRAELFCSFPRARARRRHRHGHDPRQPNSQDEPSSPKASGCGESPVRHTENWKIGPKGELADVVVWIVDPKFTITHTTVQVPRTPPEVDLKQIGCRYVPHVIAVRPG
jgi:hypothetical protein